MRRNWSNLPFSWLAAGSLWGEGTYTMVPEANLPSLPAKLPRPLPVLTAGTERLTYREEHQARADAVALLDGAVEHALALGISIPSAFVAFMTDRKIHTRVPTCTACYLEVSRGLLPNTTAEGGYLLRFMNDQQATFLWYLHLQPGSRHEVVAGAPVWRDNRKAKTLDDAVDVPNLVVCAPSFDEFIHRWWLENTIWYAMYRKQRLTAEQRTYLEAARASFGKAAPM